MSFKNLGFEWAATVYGPWLAGNRQDVGIRSDGGEDDDIGFLQFIDDQQSEPRMNEPMMQDGFNVRCQKILQVAKDLHQRRPDWVTFFRETLGVNGAARSVFPVQIDFLKFEQSKAYGEIQSMVAGLRTAKVRGGGKDEATRVITVRLPESLHEALKKEADDHRISMNKMCISKLLQVFVESENAASCIRTPASNSAHPLVFSSINDTGSNQFQSACRQDKKCGDWKS